MWSGDEDCGDSIVSGEEEHGELLVSAELLLVCFSAAHQRKVQLDEVDLLPSFCDANSASVFLGFVPSGIESGT